MGAVNQCAASSCQRPARTRDLCRSHYYKRRESKAHPEMRDPVFISSVGTARRLQALVAIGHLEKDLADRLGMKVLQHLPAS